MTSFIVIFTLFWWSGTEPSIFPRYAYTECRPTRCRDFMYEFIISFNFSYLQGRYECTLFIESITDLPSVTEW